MSIGMLTDTLLSSLLHCTAPWALKAVTSGISYKTLAAYVHLADYVTTSVLCLKTGSTSHPLPPFSVHTPTASLLLDIESLDS